MILGIVISIVIVLITLIVLHLKWSFRYWKSRNVYTPEPSIPFGNVKSMMFGEENVGAITTKVYNTVKAKGLRYGGFYFFSRPTFVPVDRTLVRNMLITDFQHFTDHSGPIDDKREPLAAHLFSLTGAKWRALRAKLTPLFTSGKLKMMFQTLVDCTNDFPYVLDETIKRKEPFDIKDTFAKYTTDVIGSVAFGIDCNCLKNPDTEFRTYGRKVFEPKWKDSVLNAISLIFPGLLNIFKLKQIDVEVENFFMNMIKETVGYRDKNNFHRNDFIQLLMDLRNREIKVESAVKENSTDGHVAYYQNGLTIEEIAAQSFVFFLAGFETSSTTLNFLMYEIVLNLEIQEKLREEIKTVLKAHDGKITYEAIQEMTYMDKCINETLRKYPPLSVTPRRCTKDYKVPDSDVVIKKGQSAFIPIYAIQHDPEYYPDPEKFDPERFSEENKNLRPPITFIPFGEGPRICIGLRMGLLQAKVGLTALLRDYKFTLNSKTKVPLRFVGRSFITSAEGGVWIEAQKV